MQSDRLRAILETVEEPKVKGSELVWIFRCRGCQTCGFTNDPKRPHWLGLEEIPNSQCGNPLE